MAGMDMLCTDKTGTLTLNQMKVQVLNAMQTTFYSLQSLKTFVGVRYLAGRLPNLRGWTRPCLTSPVRLARCEMEGAST